MSRRGTGASPAVSRGANRSLTAAAGGRASRARVTGDSPRSMRDGDRSGGTRAVTFARGGIPVLAGAGVLRGGFPGVPAVLGQSPDGKTLRPMPDNPGARLEHGARPVTEGGRDRPAVGLSDHQLYGRDVDSRCRTDRLRPERDADHEAGPGRTAEPSGVAHRG